MITLYQTPSAWGVPNISPFCVKLESYLRMVGLPYQVKPFTASKPPKGKVPFVEVDGTIMGDSHFIIEHLKRKHGDALDKGLSAQQVALGHAVRRMLEEGTYWNIVHERWARQDGWETYQPVFNPILPALLRPLALPMLRRGMLKQFHAQGTGRHKPEEILELGKGDISSLATLLGDKPFLLGDSPSSFDATVYAFTVSITAFPLDSPFRRHALAQENLVRYTQRFRERYFADWKPVY